MKPDKGEYAEQYPGIVRSNTLQFPPYRGICCLWLNFGWYVCDYMDRDCVNSDLAIHIENIQRAGSSSAIGKP